MNGALSEADVLAIFSRFLRASAVGKAQAALLQKRGLARKRSNRIITDSPDGLAVISRGPSSAALS